MHMILLSKPKGIVSQDEYFLKVLKLKLVLFISALMVFKISLPFCGENKK